MTEDNTGADLQDVEIDELESLKLRAQAMGINYHPNIGLNTLKEKVNLAIRGGKSDEPDVVGNTQPDVEAQDLSPEEIVAGYHESNRASMSLSERRSEALKEANRLVRVRVACMNPTKRDWTGEIITVSNSLVGTFKKFVSFNNPEGWHIPHFILHALRERDCQIFVNGTNEKGIRIKRAQLIKEFAIEILPPLNATELKELAQRQAMANGR